MTWADVEAKHVWRVYDMSWHEFMWKQSMFDAFTTWYEMSWCGSKACLTRLHDMKWADVEAKHVWRVCDMTWHEFMWKQSMFDMVTRHDMTWADVEAKHVWRIKDMTWHELMWKQRMFDMSECGSKPCLTRLWHEIDVKLTAFMNWRESKACLTRLRLYRHCLLLMSLLNVLYLWRLWYRPQCRLWQHYF